MTGEISIHDDDKTPPCHVTPAKFEQVCKLHTGMKLAMAFTVVVLGPLAIEASQVVNHSKMDCCRERDYI